MRANDIPLRPRIKIQQFYVVVDCFDLPNFQWLSTLRLCLYIGRDAVFETKINDDELCAQIRFKSSKNSKN